jgi:hypothetical protein
MNLTPAQYAQKKAAKVATLEAHNRLEAETIHERKIGPYPLEIDFWLKVNSSDRFYASKWLERALSKFLTMHGWNVEKKPDAGQRKDNRKSYTDAVGQKHIIGSVVWVKSRHVQPGRADLYLEKRLGNGLRYAEWIEIKVGRDKQSPEQIAFEAECKANCERYTIIKTLDDFWRYWDEWLSAI